MEEFEWCTYGPNKSYTHTYGEYAKRKWIGNTWNQIDIDGVCVCVSVCACVRSLQFFIDVTLTLDLYNTVHTYITSNAY